MTIEVQAIQRKLPYRREVSPGQFGRYELAEFRYAKAHPFEAHLTFFGPGIGIVTTWVMARELLIEGTLRHTTDPDGGDVLVRALDDPPAVEMTLRPHGGWSVLLFDWDPFTEAVADSCGLVGYGEEGDVFDVDAWLADEFPEAA